MLNEFKTAYGQPLSCERLINSIKSFISENPHCYYKLFVGTDSENREQGVEFISVIVIHRVGQGAKYFWRRTFNKNFLDLYSRLWQEALISLEISQKLLELLIDQKLNFNFEVHLDLGTNGKSKSVISEIINLIRSYGFTVKIKPEAYAASKIADHLL